MTRKAKRDYGVLVGCRTYGAADVEQIIALLEALAREKGERVKHGEEVCGCDTAEFQYAEGEADAREDVSDRCAQMLREIRGYV